MLRDAVERLPPGGSNTLRQQGLDVGVVNARFVKPMDRDVVRRALTECSFVVTVEEGRSPVGSAAPCSRRPAIWDSTPAGVCRLGIPDRFIEHGERAELLADLQLDAPGMARVCRELVAGLQNRDLWRRAASRGNETSQS